MAFFVSKKRKIEHTNEIAFFIGAHGSIPTDEGKPITLKEGIRNVFKKLVENDNDVEKYVNQIYSLDANIKYSFSVPSGICSVTIPGELNGDPSLTSQMVNNLYNNYQKYRGSTGYDSFDEVYQKSRLKLRDLFIKNINPIVKTIIKKYNVDVTVYNTYVEEYNNASKNNIQNYDTLQEIDLKSENLPKVVDNVIKNVIPDVIKNSNLMKPYIDGIINYIDKKIGFTASRTINANDTSKELCQNNRNTISHQPNVCSPIQYDEDIEHYINLFTAIKNTFDDNGDKIFADYNFKNDSQLDNNFSMTKEDTKDERDTDKMYGINVIHWILNGEELTLRGSQNLRSSTKLAFTGDINDAHIRGHTYDSKKIKDSKIHAATGQKQLKTKYLQYINEILRGDNVELTLSEIIVLFKWCYGINNIRMFTTACRIHDNGQCPLTQQKYSDDTQPDGNILSSFTAGKQKRVTKKRSKKFHSKRNKRYKKRSVKHRRKHNNRQKKQVKSSKRK
jgi:hypothetical protein